MRKKVVKNLNSYRISIAANELYNFIWNDFANDYLESCKERREEAQKILEYILQESLKLLHPFMPFITEAIWQEGKDRFNNVLLINEEL
jgi:valyl-tRNA synthetase